MTPGRVGVLALLCLAVAGCGGRADDDAPLDALRHDALARFAPTRGALGATEARSQGTALGKPIAAQLRRDFSLDASARPRAALQEALRAALAAGWRRDGSTGADAVRLAKRLPTGPATAIVVLPRRDDVLPDGVRWPALTVELTHGFA